MKESAIKCPTCLIPIEFISIERGHDFTNAIYMCPKCGWYK